MYFQEDYNLNKLLHYVDKILKTVLYANNLVELRWNQKEIIFTKVLQLYIK